MSREVRQLIIADGLIIAIGLAVWLLMGCHDVPLRCYPYLGDAPIPHDGTPTLAVTRDGQAIKLEARVPLHNPDREGHTANVRCEWRLDGKPLCSRQSRGLRVCGRSSVVADLWCLAVAPQGAMVSLQCGSSWH